MKKKKKNNGSVPLWLRVVALALLSFCVLFILEIWGFHYLLQKSSSNDLNSPQIPSAQVTTSPMDLVRSNRMGLRVLFVGNSFTYFHNMPDLVRQLAEAAKDSPPLMPIQEAPGGYTLKRHWEDGKVADLLSKVNWNYVVLQEQSQFPSFARNQLERDVYPYVRKFYESIKSVNAQTLLFLTWGYKDGDLANMNPDSYSDMQKRIDTGYRDIAKELSIPIAPVGVAWSKARQERPQLNLWDVDGKHPNLTGSYLAACVFYEVFYKKSTIGNPFTAGLEPEIALFLQTIAKKAIAQPLS